MPEYDSSVLNDEVIDLLTKLLCKDPSKRLGCNDVREIMDHQWFSNINWEDLKSKKIQAPYVPLLENETDTKHFNNVDVPPMGSLDFESQGSDAGVPPLEDFRLNH